MAVRNLKHLLLELFQAEHILSVAQIITTLKKNGYLYNKTSVYRALEKMLTEGLICRHFFKEDEALYELREDHHLHLMCSNCGKIDSIECNYTQPAQVQDFTVDHHHLTLIGKCANCSQKPLKKQTA